MRLAAKRRTGWTMASGLTDGTHAQVRVGGDWLEVVRFGSGDPLVVVPGLAGGWRLVAPLARRLGRRFEVLVCGLRGDRFPSSGPLARSMADHARDVVETIGLLGLERPAVLGVSFGGAVALEMATMFPQALGALVLVGAEARFRTTFASKIARQVLERYPLPRDSRFVNQFFNLLHAGRPTSDALAEFVVECCWETDQSVMARRLALLESFDVSDRLWRIEAPTLVLAGDRDVVVPAARQQALAAAVPGARFERLEGAGHIGFLSHAGEVARHVAGLARELRHSVC